MCGATSHVRFTPNSDREADSHEKYVRFASESGRVRCNYECPLRANSGHRGRLRPFRDRTAVGLWVGCDYGAGDSRRPPPSGTSAASSASVPKPHRRTVIGLGLFVRFLLNPSARSVSASFQTRILSQKANLAERLDDAVSVKYDRLELIRQVRGTS